MSDDTIPTGVTPTRWEIWKRGPWGRSAALLIVYGLFVWFGPDPPDARTAAVLFGLAILLLLALIWTVWSHEEYRVAAEGLIQAQQERIALLETEIGDEYEK